MAEYTLDDITQNAVIDAIDCGIPWDVFEASYRRAHKAYIGDELRENSQLLGRIKAYWQRVLLTRDAVEIAQKVVASRAAAKSKPTTAPKKPAGKS